MHVDVLQNIFSSKSYRWRLAHWSCLLHYSSFIIVAQPTGSDGAAVTQYTKNGSDHTARLNTRIVCLLDPDILKDHIELSEIGMKWIYEK